LVLPAGAKGEVPCRAVVERRFSPWAIVFAALRDSTDGLALCWLAETAPTALLADGVGLDEMFGFQVTERGLASLVADALNDRDQGKRSADAFYWLSRKRDPTEDEVLDFMKRCASSGAPLSYAKEVLPPLN
jgi:hypothetical protein